MPAKQPTASSPKRPAKKIPTSPKAVTVRGGAVPASAAVKPPKPLTGKAQVHSSKVSYDGPLFRVTTETVTEPGGSKSTRDIIRHNGSVVILAVDASQNPHDPSILVERQYRHAVGQFLFELPAGRIEEGEPALAAAKRELIEETGYRAARWSRLVRYFASPGFLAESMQVFLAEDLRLGEARPEPDEKITLTMVPLSELLTQIEQGKILDGKTILSVLFYSRQHTGASPE